MIARIQAEVFINIGDRDPEDVAADFNRGLLGAVEHFPNGEVIVADVEHIREATAEEIAEKGLTE